MMQQNNCQSNNNNIISSGSLSSRGVIIDNSSSMQLDAFVQQHLLSNIVSANISKNCSPERNTTARSRYHPLIKQQSPIQYHQNQRQYCNTALADINNNNNISQHDNQSITDKTNQENNHHHFYSVIERSSDILMQSPSKNDKQTVYKSFTQSPSPPSRNNRLRNLEDSSSYHNNVQQQQQQKIQQINDSFCNTQSPKKNNNDSESINNSSQKKRQSAKKSTRFINDENSIDTQKQSPSFQQAIGRKSVVLEQENLQLKNQIEMLKAALLGLCQNQKIEIPQILPLISTNTTAKVQEPIPVIQISQIQNNQDILEASQHPIQSNDQQQQQDQLHQSQSTDKFETFETQVSNSSPTKSMNRRKRSQRQQSPNKQSTQNSLLLRVSQDHSNINNDNNCGQGIQDSPDFNYRDLPLQIQSRKPLNLNVYKTDEISNKQNHINDDTMVIYDKSIENQQQQQQEKFDNQNESQIIDDKNEVQQQNQNNDSIMLISQDHQVYNDNNSCHNDQYDISLHDQSQIQIKYAKMLEELQDNEASINLSKIQYSPNNQNFEDKQQLIEEQIVQETRDTATFQGLNNNATKTFDIEDMRRSKNEKEIDIEIPTGILMETMKSNKYEYQQFYENELHQLKSELQMFENEEQQLLNLIIKPIVVTQKEETDKTNSPYKRVFQKSLTQQSPKKEFALDQVDQNSSIMNNLREAFLELQEVLQDQKEDEDLIRPVKILSPTQHIQRENFTNQHETQLKLEQDQKQLNTSKINMTPTDKQYPITSQSIISCDKQQDVSVMSSSMQKSPLIDKNSIIFKMQKEYSNFKSTQKSFHDIFNPLQNAYRAKNQSCIKNDKKCGINQLDKSPSQVSLQNYKYTADIDYNSRSATPVREKLRSESRLRRQQQSTLNKLKMSTTKLLDSVSNINDIINIEDVELPTVESIELLNAKRKSLAVGLKQQEEPTSDGEDKTDKRSISNLRIIKPILMDQPSFDSKRGGDDYQQLISEPDEVRIEIINDEQRNLDTIRQKSSYNNDLSLSMQYQSYYDGDCSTGLMRQKQSVTDLLENTKQHVKKTQDKFFGLYSKEKSDILKYQRQESIKRAEELLTDLIKDQSFETKRPSYLGSPKKDRKIDSSFDQSPKIIVKGEASNKNLQPILQQSTEFNDLSFQQDSHKYTKDNQKNNLRESTRESIISSGHNEVINLQISPDRQTIDYHHEMSNCISPYGVTTKIDMKLQQFDAFDSTYQSIVDESHNKNRKEHNTIDTEYYNGYQKQQMVNSTPSQYDVSSQISNRQYNNKLASPSEKGYMLEPQIINRRKSLESTIMLNTKMYQANLQSNPKRRTLQLRKGGLNNIKPNDQTIDHHHISNYNSKSELNQTTLSSHTLNNQKSYNNLAQQSNYKQFQNNSQSCEKSKTHKTLALSKTVENLMKNNNIESCNQTISHNYKNSNNCNQSSEIQYQKYHKIEEPTILAHPYKMSTMDAEAFYMERSKSVVKRREELQRKKQLEIQNKIEAKNMRMEQFKNTRNSQLNTSNGRASSNQKYSNNGIIMSQGTQEAIQNNNNNNSSQNIHHNNGNQLSHTQYHSKQKSIDSRSMTPIKASQDKSQRVSHLGAKQYESIQTANNNNQISQKPTQLNRQKSLGACQIKFEKRKTENKACPTIQTNNNSEMYNQTVLLNIQTPNSINDNTISQQLQQINPGTISAKSVKNISIMPSNSQSKTTNTKITSECSTFRRQSNYNGESSNSNRTSTIDFNEQQYYQPSNSICQNQSQGKISNSNFQQRKPSQGSSTHSFKQNIINRTMRLNQQKPKEYLQLKQEQKMKQIMLNTIETNNQTQISTIKQTIQSQMDNTTSSSQSGVIFNYKQNTTMQQPQIINKAKALTKNFINFQPSENKKSLNNSKSAAKLSSNQTTHIQMQQPHHNFNMISSVLSSQYNTQQQQQQPIQLKGIRAATTVEYNQNDTHCYTDKKKLPQGYIEDLSNQLSQVLNGFVGPSKNNNNNRYDKQQQQQIESTYSNRSGDVAKSRKECLNCVRLISKGLSTDFCLEHYNTPRCIDD